MIRLFIGLDFDPDLAQRLAGLGFGLPGARWVPARNIHLTLRFVGEVEEEQAEELHHNLAAISASPFSLTLAGFGLFGDARKASALWVGVEKSEALEALAAKAGSAMIRAGLKGDPKRFSPHVTLARLKNPDPARLQGFLHAAPAFRADAVPVESFVLFQSRLYPDGPEYEALERYPLR